jgi:protein SEY1
LNEFLNQPRWSRYTSHLALAVIGPQGTGKSTLLNCLFGESFKEKEKDSVGRTTVGADLRIFEKSDTACFLLIDSEGINCPQRLEDFEGDKEKQVVFDIRRNSFILSVVDVLIVNIMVNQIWHAEASCLKLVKDIADINRKFIRTDTRKKTIIFVIRDFDSEEYDEEAIKQKFEKEIKFNQEDKAEDYFVRKYVFIRYIKLKDQFKEDYESLKSTLENLL